MSSWRRILTPYDIALGLLILALGVFSLQFVAAAATEGAGTLLVEIEGRLVHEITFTAGDPQRLIVVNAPRGAITIELTGGKARVLPLPVDVCPEGICWHSGWTGHPAKAIVCLPNLLVVRIARPTGDVDGITR